MITKENICAHIVEFTYRSKSKNAIPDESEIEHVTNMIIQGYTQGELCLNTTINNREYEFRGWWSIKK